MFVTVFDSSWGKSKEKIEKMPSALKSKSHRNLIFFIIIIMQNKIVSDITKCNVFGHLNVHLQLNKMYNSLIKCIINRCNSLNSRAFLPHFKTEVHFL